MGLTSKRIAKLLRRGEPGKPVIADPDNGEPRSHATAASALTAAAASALPPRRPCIVT